MPTMTAKARTSNGRINRVGLIEIARKATTYIGNEDLYPSLLGVLEKASRDHEIYDNRYGFGKVMNVGKRSLSEHLGTNYFARLEMMAIGLTTAVLAAIGNLK